MSNTAELCLRVTIEIDYLATRRSFLPPPSELDDAASLLDNAANALLSNDRDSAQALIEQADIASICHYDQRIRGKTVDEVHRYRHVPNAPPITKDRVKLRMPPKAVEREVFEQDGWRCRFCGIRVIAKEAIKRLYAEFPEATRSTRANYGEHCALNTLCSSLDHVLPHSRGGTNDRENLVATCGPCQFGRNYWTLDEVGIEDPRTRAPIVDSWDGLTRLCT